jgi:MerR family transcriptional regulator/heat shock protein HspR
MNSDPFPQAEDFPDSAAETGACYSLEVIAELAGVNTQTVIQYHEQGFLKPIRDDDREPTVFDTESLRQLRRIEHLRATCEVNDAGLALILNLLHEVECLREERRQMLR